MLLSYNSLEQHMNGWISSSICTFSYGSWASIDDEVNHLPKDYKLLRLTLLYSIRARHQHRYVYAYVLCVLLYVSSWWHEERTQHLQGI